MYFESPNKNLDVEKLIDYLLIVGLILGALSMIQYDYFLQRSFFISQNNPSVVNFFPFGYKISKTFEVLLIITAGLLSYLYEEKCYMPRAIKILMWLGFIWILGHSIIAFQSEFKLSEPFDQKGPLVPWSMLLIFCGFNEQRWKKILPVIYFIILLIVVDLTINIFKLGSGFNREMAVAFLRVPLNDLFWLSPLLFLIPQDRLYLKLLSLYSLSLLGISSLMIATRSWLVYFFFYCFMFSLIAFLSANSATKRILIIYSAVFIFALGIGTAYIVANTQINTGVEVLINRIDKDSRSTQLSLFFSRVPTSQIILGAGPRGTWKWSEVGPNAKYRFVDGAYLLMLYIGGIPLLLTYCSLVIYPFVKSLLYFKLFSLSELDRACIILGCVWSLALTGFSTYNNPNLTLGPYVILLCSGRCWWLLNQECSQSPE